MVVPYHHHRSILKSTIALITASVSTSSLTSSSTTIPLVAITATTAAVSLYYTVSILQVNAIPTTNRNVSTTTTTTSNSAFVVNPKGNTIAVTSSQRQQDRKMTVSSSSTPLVDPEYPGTAVERLQNVHRRVQELLINNSLQNQEWETIRQHLLWAGGLRDLPTARPGQGYTGHSFNDFNHVDLTCMVDSKSDNENDGSVVGIAIGNRLGDGIRIASLPELGPGGSWSTCAIGCHTTPPNDVAHIQFHSRIAFKLVWVPTPNFDQFVLVDDAGTLLATGKPIVDSDLPPLRERQRNYRIVEGSKYATVADQIAKQQRLDSVASE